MIIGFDQETIAVMTPKPKPRTCLRCGKKFNSEGPWNRLCKSQKCRKKWERCSQTHNTVENPVHSIDIEDYDPFDV